MNPAVIADICGRGLSFWTYQVAQEASFQSMLLKETQEVRCDHLTSIFTGRITLITLGDVYTYRDAASSKKSLTTSPEGPIPS